MPEGMTMGDDFVMIGGTSRGTVASHGVTAAIHNDHTLRILSLAITISQQVLDELAWKIGDRVFVLEGRNQSKGILLIKPCIGDALGSYRLTKQGSAATMKISSNKFANSDLPKEGRIARPVKYMAFNTELKIILPKWDDSGAG